MRPFDGLGEREQPHVLAHGVRKRVGDAQGAPAVLRAVQRLAHDLAHPAGWDALAPRCGSRRVERHEACRVQAGSRSAPRQLPLRRLHLPLALEERHLAAEHDAGDATRRVRRCSDGLPELLRDPRVAPPDHPDVAGVVANGRFGGPDTPATPQPHLVRVPEHGFDGLLLPRAQPGDGGPLPAVHMAQGEEVEEVADGGVRGREHAPPDEHAPDGIGLRAVNAPQRGQRHVERVRGRRSGLRFRGRRSASGRAGRGPVAEEAAYLVNPALAARGIELGVGNGKEATLVQRLECGVRAHLPAQGFEEAVDPAGDGPVREAVGRLHVEDVPQGPHLRCACPLAAFRRHNAPSAYAATPGLRPYRAARCAAPWIPAFAGMTGAGPSTGVRPPASGRCPTRAGRRP